MSSEIKQGQRSYLPPCWNDDTRMRALFSTFRKKELNPTGWQEKMDFWVNTIMGYSKAMKQAVISANDICIAFERDKRFPNCIDEVLDYMCKQGSVKTVGEFSSYTESSGWLGWGYDLLIKKPLSWGYAAMMKGVVFEQLQEKDLKFVVLDVIRDIANSILMKHAELVEQEKVDYLVEFEEFRSHCRNICQNDNFNFAVMQLEQEKNAKQFTESGKQYIKFKKDENDDINIFTECDQAILKLRRSVQILMSEVDSVEKEINSHIAEAKLLVHQGFKAKAMSVLRKKKKLENDLNKKTASLYNLETLLMQLKNTSSNKQVLQAYNAGVAAMKSTLSNDLDINKVDETMADLEEVADNFADIENVLSKGISVNDDDDKLEQELEEILSEDKDSVPHDKTLADETEDLLKRFQALSVPSENNFPISKPSSTSKAVTDVSCTAST